MKFIPTNNLKGDLFGGITAGIVALPLALAFGIQAFGSISVDDVGNIGALGALAGLVGAIMLGFFLHLKMQKSLKKKAISVKLNIQFMSLHLFQC